jgi:drug/metabolite transporter (DMT)-like permease
VAVAVAAVSSAAVIVSALPDVPPLTLAMWRTAIVAAVLAPWVRPVRGSDLARIGLAGLCLAAHFAVWFQSLHETSVLRSTVLVCLGPVWTGLFEWAILREPPRFRYWLGLALAVPAIAVMSLDGLDAGSWRGDALALLAGILGSAYFLIGRTVRARVGIGTYASLVCTAAALVLAPAAVATGAPLLDLPLEAWLGILALALGPQLLGHNGFNYALRWLPASTVTTATLLEPVGATLIAWATLGQRPGLLAAIAGAVILAGVGVAAVPGAKRRPGGKHGAKPAADESATRESP